MSRVRTGVAVIFCLMLAGQALADEKAVGPYLQSISVNIQASNSQGSGSVILVPRKGDNQVAFVLTAEHVVDGLRQVKTVISSSGKERKVVRYNDASVVQEVPNPDGSRIVGDTSLDAKVICVDESRDIALLRIRAKGKFPSSVKFCERKVLPVATEILHCGAPGGKDTGGSASVTSGIISRTGVRIQEFGGSENGIFDQIDCAGMGGSSGGMVCLRGSGDWVGMITLGLRSGGDNFHWMVPVRSVRDFVDEAGIEWLLDPEAELPSEDVLEGIPLEITAGVKEEVEPTKAPTVTLPKPAVTLPDHRPMRMHKN